ncbi:MAG: hypothetical protein KAZ18_07390 [Acinetobacter sp.]|nr:hypothetical protein [Acinetobacter sp.]
MTNNQNDPSQSNEDLQPTDQAEAFQGNIHFGGWGEFNPPPKVSKEELEYIKEKHLLEEHTRTPPPPTPLEQLKHLGKEVLSGGRDLTDDD